MHIPYQSRSNRVLLAMLLFTALALLSACQPVRSQAAPLATSTPDAPDVPSTQIPTAAPTTPAEVAFTRIPISGPGADRKAEISGLAWCGDTLVLLPQFPGRMAITPGGALLTLSKQEILDFLDGKAPGPLEPRLLPLDSGGLEKSLTGFEGFESIAFHGEQAYLTIEASPGGKMKSYLVRGRLSDDESSLRLEAEHLVDVPLDKQIMNYSNEAILIVGERVVVFYEANGTAAIKYPRAHVYNLDLQEAGTLPLPALEYRITDATQPDAQGRFWVTNIFTPLELFIVPSRDPLAEQYGKGATHATSSAVERLVEMQFGQDGQISLVPTAPIQLQLSPDQALRNWEGLARLDERGFLLATDKFPETILAFVPGQP